MNRVEVFTAQEITPQNKTIDKYIIISESIYLNFDVNSNQKSILTLASWAYLQSLQNIRRRKEKNDLLSLSWKGDGGLTQILSVNKSQEFVDLLVNQMQKFGVKVSKNTQKKAQKIDEREVTGELYANLNI